MIEIIINLIASLSVAITLYLSYVAFKSTKNLKAVMKNSSSKISYHFDLNTNQIAVIEKSLTNLKTVLVAANVVEAPEGLLREAVEYNFNRNVKYIFLISKSNFDQFKNTYFKIFEVYLNKNNPNTQLLELYPLEIDWGDRPYIFYETFDKNLPPQNAKSIYGFVGEDIKKGIASYYKVLPESYGFSLFNAIVAACGVELQIKNKINEFKEDLPKVVDIRLKQA